eukprot:501422-Rhodomonas_salina.1
MSPTRESAQKVETEKPSTLTLKVALLKNLGPDKPGRKCGCDRIRQSLETQWLQLPNIFTGDTRGPCVKAAHQGTAVMVFDDRINSKRKRTSLSKYRKRPSQEPSGSPRAFRTLFSTAATASARAAAAAAGSTAAVGPESVPVACTLRPHLAARTKVPALLGHEGPRKSFLGRCKRLRCRPWGGAGLRTRRLRMTGARRTSPGSCQRPRLAGSEADDDAAAAGAPEPTGGARQSTGLSAASEGQGHAAAMLRRNEGPR